MKRGGDSANRAIAYVWKKDFAAAEKDMAAVEAINPENPVVLRARALMAEQKDDCVAAMTYYTKSLATDPQNNFAVGHRAQCERMIGKDEEALADSEKALKANPGWMELRVMRANIFLFQGKKDAVAREAELLMEQNPTSDYAFVAAGRIYAQIDRSADAMKAFDRALAIKPEAYIYLNRAQSRPFTDYAGRLADLDAALRLEPKNPDAMAEKAEQLAATGDLKGALQLYDQAIKVAPDTGYLSLGRAIILYKAGSTAEAERILSEGRGRAKTASDLNGLCWRKATAGILLESALQDCLDALKLAPDRGPIIDSLAFVKLRMSKLDEAIALYNQAIEKRTSSASYMGRAIAYARKGDMQHAQSDRAEALRLDGDAETRFAEYGLKF
jgi:tetratricopeptide (TPR) repeat protein